MDDELLRAITALVQRLVTISAQDEGVRNDLRALAGAVLLLTEPTSVPEVQKPGRHGEAGSESNGTCPDVSPAFDRERDQSNAPPTPEAVRTLQPLPELTFAGPHTAENEVRGESGFTSSRGVTTDAELPAVEARFRLKAEGVRWAVTRRREIQEGTDFRVAIAPRDREILGRSKDLDCYLWMNTPDFVVPSEPAMLEDVAVCFETAADAVALVRGMLPDIEANRKFFEPALDLLAEVQSALRVAIERINGQHDPDQYLAFDWLRGVAAREQIYLRRYMRLDDPADPGGLPDLAARIEALDTKFQGLRQRARKKQSHMNRLRYHARLIGEGTGGEHDWRKVAGAIDEMLKEEVPASNVEVREALLPILDLMPDLEDLPPGFGRVLREIDRYLAGRTSSPKDAPVEATTPEVAQAARLLEGKGVVLIGGSRRPEAHDALKAALRLNELVWVETREHESTEKFIPYVARPDIALVLLAIRWSSHSFGDVKRFCDRYGKSMVRLPGGYNPNQVAAQILAQCSGQLGGF